MSLTLNLLQVSKEGKNQAVCRKLHVCVQFYPWFKFYFLLFLGMVMYDNDMIMSLKQKKITGFCRIHDGLADCRSIGRTCITWPELPAETIAANRKQKLATRMGTKVMQFGYLCSAVMYYPINSINTLNFSISSSAFIQGSIYFKITFLKSLTQDSYKVLNSWKSLKILPSNFPDLEKVWKMVKSLVKSKNPADNSYGKLFVNIMKSKVSNVSPILLSGRPSFLRATHSERKK